MTNQNQNNAAQAATKDIREGFELTYAADAGDPASATDLFHFTNGWRACVMSQVRAPVADERAAFARSVTGRDDLEPYQVENVIDANRSRWKTWQDRAALATVPLPNQSPIRLSAEVLEYMKEGIDSATQCEEADIDHDFANELGRLMQGPLFGAPLASAPVAGERAAFKKCHSAIIKALSSIARADGPDTRKEDDPELLYRSPVMDDVVRIRVALDECSAALASAPVADERHAVDPCGYVAVKSSAVDWLKDKFPALTIKAGLCERIGGRLYTITRLMRDHDAALASAPVAGEAFMYGIMGPDGKAHFEEFCVSGDRTELQTEVVDHLNRDNPEGGTYSVVALFRDAAPQASAEARWIGIDLGENAIADVRNAALEQAYEAVACLFAAHYLHGNLSALAALKEAGDDIRALKQPQAAQEQQ